MYVMLPHVKKFCLFATTFLSLLTNVETFANGSSDDVAIAEKPVITEIHLGNPEAENKIEIYISPSCLHCGQFIVETLEEFMHQLDHKTEVLLKFLPTSAKDVFIMKLLQHEAKDEKSYYDIYKNYIKRAIATVNFVKPTKEQISLYKGSVKDPEMIKFQVVASEFGFSDKKIVDAFPDPKMQEPFEHTLMQTYSERVRIISKLTNTKQLDLPLIVKDGKISKSLR